MPFLKYRLQNLCKKFFFARLILKAGQHNVNNPQMDETGAIFTGNVK